MKDVQEVLDALPNSEFRRSVRLHRKETEYLNRKGLEMILQHAADFIEKRLALDEAEKQHIIEIIKRWLLQYLVEN